MADTQQGVRQQSARDAAGTTDTHDGDMRALFESVATVPAGSTYNEAFMLWLQDQTGSSADNINDLAALYASQQDGPPYNWSSVGELAEEFPVTLPDLEFWYDASDAGTITESGGAVSQWDDKSGNGYHLIQGTPGNQPTITTDGANDAIQFDGVDDFMSASNINPGAPTGVKFQTVFTVSRITSLAADGMVLSFSRVISTANRGQQFYNTFGGTNNAVEGFMGTSSGSGSTVQALKTGDTSIVAWISRHVENTGGAPNPSDLLDNDGLTGSDTNVGVLQADITKITVGREDAGTRPLPGFIMMAGAYSRRLDDTERLGLMDYLKGKWSGLT